MEARWDGIVRQFRNCQQMIEKWDEGHYLVGTPAQRKLEEKLTQILGRPTIVTSRGMTAIQSVIFALTRSGSTIACSEDIYPGTRLWLKEMLNSNRLGHVIWFDPSRPKTFLEDRLVQLVFTETFGNSRQMRVADIPAMLEICRPKGCYLVVDTTFTPLYLPPDDPKLIVVGSMTKFHQPGDEVMGGYISAAPEVIEQIKATRQYNHSVMLPLTAAEYLKSGVLDEIETRYQQHSRNTWEVAGFCLQHTAVEQIWYPGLPSHVQFALVKRDYGDLGGGVFFLQLKGGTEAVVKLADQLAGKHQWEIGVSFGSAKWRILPYIGKFQQHAGAEGIVRISPGYENLFENLRVLEKALDSLL